MLSKFALHEARVSQESGSGKDSQPSSLEWRP